MYLFLNVWKFGILITFRLNSNQIIILDRKQEIKKYQVKSFPNLTTYIQSTIINTHDKKLLKKRKRVSKILKHTSSVEKEEAKWKQNPYLIFAKVIRTILRAEYRKQLLNMRCYQRWVYELAPSWNLYFVAVGQKNRKSIAPLYFINRAKYPRIESENDDIKDGK